MSELADRRVFVGMTAIIQSGPMRRLMQLIERAAAADAAALITGESGVGKELAARALHQLSDRAAQPWVDVSCAALPDHLVESELFGHVKGAFTGADSAKPGLFELADKGTLFLDEIAELPLPMQAKLLRVLDGVPYYRLGGARKVTADVRIVAATNRNLEEMVRHGGFRADLYHRISQIRLDVPPLRKRRADVLPLAAHFLAQCKPAAALTADAERLLLAYSWPGNVRELRNVLTQAAVFASGDRIAAADIPVKRTGPGRGRDLLALASSLERTRAGAAADLSLDRMERHMIRFALDETNGHQQRAAELLGISRRTLSRKLKTYAATGAAAEGIAQ